MYDPANNLIMLPAAVPSSPTISSLSSSDLDSQSTGSFFHDRSTTLGTLMGVTLQAITFRASSHHHQQQQQETPVSAVDGDRRNKKPDKKRKAGEVVAARQRRRRRWWRLCRDDQDYSRRASLGEYLDVERRFGVEVEGVDQEMPRNGRALFAEGRVLPPVEVVDESSPPAAAICRFSAVERWCNLV